MDSRSSTKESAKRLAHGIKNGYRSGLENQVAEQLQSKNIPVDYENVKIKFIQPAKIRTYTPDFVLPNNIIIETKGRFISADRQKHLLIQEQYPNLDIRFVFSNPNQKISKKSKTTYAMWCQKNRFKYAKQYIPDEWLTEPYRTIPQLQDKNNDQIIRRN